MQLHYGHKFSTIITHAFAIDLHKQGLEYRLRSIPRDSCPGLGHKKSRVEKAAISCLLPGPY